jgi:hypothetical protein
MVVRETNLCIILSSGFLHSIRRFKTDVSGLPTGLKTSVSKHRMLCNNPERWGLRSSKSVCWWVHPENNFQPLHTKCNRYFIYRHVTEKHRLWMHFCNKYNHKHPHHSPVLTQVILTTPGLIFTFFRINFVGTSCSCLFLTLDLVALTKSSSSADEPTSLEKLSDSEPLQQASFCCSSSLRLITCSIAGVIGYEYGDSTGLLHRLKKCTMHIC